MTFTTSQWTRILPEKIREHKVFLLILFTAALLRLVSLESLPLGLNWDEASIGYNGYGIATVHRDEWLQRMPMIFKSFGEYKAAAAIYLDAISTKMFSINTFAIRFPMAMAGIFTVFMTYWIALELFQKKSGALIAAALVAVSPLNIQFSRIAFENTLAVAFITLAVALFLWSRRKIWLLLPAAVTFVLAMYSNHSVKITGPLVLLVLALFYRKTLLKNVPWAAAAIIVGTILVAPLARETLFGNGGERFYMTSAMMTRDGFLPLQQVLSVLVTNTTAHLSPQFLLFGTSTTLRHSTEKFGVLSYLEFAFVVIGCGQICYQLFRKSKHGRDRIAKEMVWVVLAVFIGVLPAIISNDVPNGNRAHGIIPWIQILAAYGFLRCEVWVCKQKKQKTLTSMFYTGTIIVLIVQTLLYTYWYVQTYSGTQAAKEFQYGYEEAVQFARQKEREVHTVIFTSAYGQPYIYILLFKKLTPIQFHQGALANYEIRDLNWQNDRNRTNVLIVGTPKEIPADAQHIVKEIRYPGGEVAFRIVEQ